MIFFKFRGAGDVQKKTKEVIKLEQPPTPSFQLSPVARTLKSILVGLGMSIMSVLITITLVVGELGHGSFVHQD